MIHHVRGIRLASGWYLTIFFFFHLFFSASLGDEPADFHDQYIERRILQTVSPLGGLVFTKLYLRVKKAHLFILFNTESHI